MKRRRVLLPILVLAGGAVWFLLPPSPERDPAPAPPTSGTDAAAPLGGNAADAAAKAPGEAGAEPVELGGLVLDATDGRAISGASVAYEGMIVAMPPARTDSRGLYRLEAPERLGWESRLRIAAEGYLAVRIEVHRFQVGPGGSVPPVYLEPVLARRPGRVVDVDGKPVAGARVRVGDEEPPFVADGEGRFGPVSVGRDDLLWTAWSEDHFPNSGEWELDGADAAGELRAVLAPAAFTPGTVVDEAGRPLARAVVFEYRDPSRRRFRTDEDGKFRWPMAPGEQVHLVALAGGRQGAAWAWAGAPVRIVAEPYGRIPHPHMAPSPGPLRPAATVVLRVFDPDGKPLPGVAAESDPGPGFEAYGHDWTDGDGVARLPVGAGEPVRVRVHRRFFTAAVENVRLEPGETAEAGPFVLRPVPPRPRPRLVPVEAPPGPEGPFLVGRVVDAGGRPVPDADVAPVGVDEEWTDLAGRFRIPAGPKGRAIPILVSVPGYAPLRAVAVAGGPEATVRLPPRGAIRVRLVGADPEIERPETWFSVWADPGLGSTFLDQDGPFALEEADSVRIDCPAGTWPFAFEREGGDPIFLPAVTVSAGEETRIEYRFPRLGRLAGRVIGPDGAAVGDARVLVAATGGELGTTDEEGRFRFEREGRGPRIPAGRYALRVLAPGFAPALTAPVDLTADGGSISVRLSPGGRIRGRLVDRTGAPVENADVDWLPESGPSPFGTVTEEDGTFELDETFPPGIVRLRVRAPRREERVEEVSVVEGEWTDAVLRLE